MLLTETQTRRICQAAVKNLLTLPVDHPAWALSLAHIEKLAADMRHHRRLLYGEKAARQTA
jgi:hypothetical protein